MYLVFASFESDFRCLHVGSNGAILKSASFADMKHIISYLEGNVPIILIPAEKLLLTEITLPSVSLKERQRIAPFALEERLLTDPETVFVAFGTKQQNGKTSVAVIDRDLFDQWHQAWLASGLRPVMAIPDCLAIQWTPKTWSIVLLDNRALVRTGEQSGFSIAQSELKTVLPVMLAALPAGEIEKLVVWHTSKNPVVLESGYPVDYRDAEISPYWDVAHLSNQLNLLQGPYRPKARLSDIQKKWRTCFLAGIAAIGIALMSNAIALLYLQHEKTKLSDALSKTYHGLFPDEISVLDPEVRTTRLVAQYKTAVTGAEFLRCYAALGKSIEAVSGIQVQSLAYADHHMQLTIAVDNAGVLAAWMRVLPHYSLSIKVVSTTLRGSALQVVVLLLPERV